MREEIIPICALTVLTLLATSSVASACRSILPNGTIVLSNPVPDDFGRPVCPIALGPPSLTQPPVFAAPKPRMNFTTPMGPFTTGPIGPFTTFSNSLPGPIRHR